jgi:hypothetical protein
MTRRAFYLLLAWALAILAIAVVASLFACIHGRGGCPAQASPTNTPAAERSCPRGR